MSSRPNSLLSPRRKLPSWLLLESFLAFSPLNVSLNVQHISLFLDLMYKYSHCKYSYVYILGWFPTFSGGMFLRLIDLKLKIIQKSPSFHECLTWTFSACVPRMRTTSLVSLPVTAPCHPGDVSRFIFASPEWWLRRVFLRSTRTWFNAWRSGPIICLRECCKWPCQDW